MAAGVDIVQVGSFVHPEKVPQMADTDELFRTLVAEKPSGTDPLGPGAQREGPGARPARAAWSCSAWASRPPRPTAGRTPAWAPRRPSAASSPRPRRPSRPGKQVQVSRAERLRLRLRGPRPGGAGAGHRARLPRGRPHEHQPGRHRRPRPSRRRCGGSFGEILELDAGGPSAPATSTTPTAWAWPTSTRPWRRVSPASRPPSPASAAAPSPRWRPATWPPRTWSTACSAAGQRRTSTSTRSSPWPGTSPPSSAGSCQAACYKTGPLSY